MPVTRIFGSNVKTPEVLIYGNNVKGFDERPGVVYGDGDGTVNMVSLLVLESLWKKSRSDQPFKMIMIRGVSHTSILKEMSALNEIVREIEEVNTNRVVSSYFWQR